MRQTPRCRILIDLEPNSGCWNMAVDEALLTAAVERGECTVRIYRWREATLSLGYFQDEAEARRMPELASLPCVRRLTGGGAILHHHELTYSVTLPPRHPLPRVSQDHSALYGHVHDRIIAVLKEYGVTARMRGSAAAGSRIPKNSGVGVAVSDHRVGLAASVPGRREASDPTILPHELTPRILGNSATPVEAEPFLCFGRGDERDIVFQGRKIVGSAQRRRRGAILQHGSLLLRRSEFAPHHPGVLDLAEDAAVDEELPGRLAAEIGRLLSPDVERTTLDEQERQLAAGLAERKYRHLNWKLERGEQRLAPKEVILSR